MKINTFRTILCFLLAALVFSSTFGTPVRSAQAEDTIPGGESVPGELIVRLNGQVGKPEAVIQALTANHDAVVKRISIDNTSFLMEFQSDEAAQQAIPDLANQPGVLFVERNKIIRIPPTEELMQSKTGIESLSTPSMETYNPNDNLRRNQWHLDKILFSLTAAPETNPPCIVVIDSGVDYTHPDLEGKVYLGYDAFDDDMDPMDVNGHGTQVGGIAAGKTNNTIGISGVSPNSNILAVRVIGPDGWGTSWMIAEGINWANSISSTACGGQDPKVYNLSLAGCYSAAVDSAIQEAYAKGRLVVASAGNSDSPNKYYPGADPHAFGVAATEEGDHRTYNSNYDSAETPWVDISAPGWNILSTIPGGYGTLSGTSMASSVVAGVAARVWAKYASYTLAQVKSRLTSTGDVTQGFPRSIKRIDLYRALGGKLLTLQGQVFNSANITPLAGASVNVFLDGVKKCSTMTNGSGFYTCTGLDTGKYTVKVTQSGRPPVSASFTVSGSKFNANLAMSRNLGSSTSDDWTVTTMWPAWQPFHASTGQGMETDLWLVAPDGACFNAWYHPMDQDPWQILMPRDAFLTGHTEAGWIHKNYGGTLQVWVILWDGTTYPESSRITGSGLQFKAFMNNALVKTLNVPSSPTTADSDGWFVGTINLDNHTWTTANQIRTDAQLPACITTP